MKNCLETSKYERQIKQEKRTRRGINTKKTTLKHIRIKLLKTNNKEKI